MLGKIGFIGFSILRKLCHQETLSHQEIPHPVNKGRTNLLFASFCYHKKLYKGREVLFVIWSDRGFIGFKYPF